MVQRFSRTTRTTPSLMTASSDNDRAMGRVSPHAYFSGRVSPPSSYVLTKAHILDAIARSNDDGGTLDLSNKNLVDVGEAGAEELAQVGRGEDLLDECRVLRIALVGNYLSSLPMSFARLSHLRYLTLRSNNFSVFPEVLTTMSSLEILDFSRNKIRGLPTNPGTLVNLRVMSISRNKIRKLPSYLWKFNSLTVVKADHNPIEWPPRHIMEPEEDLEDSDVMHRWVNSLKSWIAENFAEDEKSMTHPAETQIGESPVIPDASGHVRSISVDSERSIYSTSSYDNSMKDIKPDSPPAIDTANVSPSIAEGIHASPESYLPMPEDSLPSVDDDTARPNYNAHGRNKSYASAGETRAPSLSVQKSLPDLRLANGRVPLVSQMRSRAPSVEAKKKASNESFSSVGESSTSGFEAPSRSRPPRAARHEPLPSIYERKPPSMDFERNSYFRRLSTLPVSTILRTTPTGLLSVVDSVRGILFAVSQIYQSLQHYTVYCIDERLSAVLMKVLDPASSCLLQLINALDKFDSTSKRGCPSPSVCRNVVESCRDNVAMFGKAVGMLAMQLKVLASRDDVRYSRQMLLVIYGATAEISNSWQGIAPQLDSIESLLRDDLPSPPPSTGMATPTPPRTAPLKSQLASQASSRVLIPPIAEQPEPPPASAPPAFPRPAPLTRAHSAQPQSSSPSTAPAMKRPAQSEGRSRMSRRHAGSFSVKDVEIGRSLPSNNEPSPPAGGVASGSNTPTPRSHTISLRSNPSTGSPLPPLPVPNPTPPQPHPSPSLHSRQNSSQNVMTSSPQLSLPGPPKGASDVPLSTNGLVDKRALDAMAAAVQAAPAVWSTLEEISNEMSGLPVDVHGSLVKAQAVTRRLGDNIRAIQEGHLNADRKALREDAHVFIKTVISLSKVVKDYGAAHRLSGQLRSDIAKLTNATQEFVMLLHVSSFAPSTPRPLSPMVSAYQSSTNGAGSSSNTASQPLSAGGSTASASEERPQLGGLGAGLGRSRSAQPPASSKVVASGSPISPPRSALPHQQSFKVPTTPRVNGTSKLRLGNLALGMDGGLPVELHAQTNGL